MVATRVWLVASLSGVGAEDLRVAWVRASAVLAVGEVAAVTCRSNGIGSSEVTMIPQLSTSSTASYCSLSHCSGRQQAVHPSLGYRIATMPMNSLRAGRRERVRPILSIARALVGTRYQHHFQSTKQALRTH
jgi:hypothetical protein